MSFAEELKIKIGLDSSGFAKGISGVRSSVTSFEKDAERSFGSAGNSLRSLVAGFAIFGGASLLIRGTSAAVSDFEKNISNVATLFPGVGKEAEDVGADILALGGEFGRAGALASAAYEAISGGSTAENAIENISAAAKFAKGNLADMSSSTRLLNTVLNVFGAEAGGAAVVVDKLTRIVALGVTTGSEMAGTFGRGASLAKLAGVSIDELGAVLIAGTKAGLSTSAVMSGFNQIISNVAKPTAEATKQAGSMGREFSLAAIQSKGLAQFLLDIATAANGDSQALSNLFGSTEALNLASSLVSKEGLKSFYDGLNDLKNSAGAADAAFQKQNSTFSATAEAIRNDVERAFIVALLPSLRDAAKLLRENSGELIAFGRSVADGIGGTIRFIVDHRKEIFDLGKAWIAFKVASAAGDWFRGINTSFRAMAGSASQFGKDMEFLTSIGSTRLQALGVSAKLAAFEINAASGKVSGLSGVLSNLGPVALAAFAGWNVGKLIGEVTGLSSAMEKYYLIMYGSGPVIDAARRAEEAFDAAQVGRISTMMAVRKEAAELSKQAGANTNDLNEQIRAIRGNASTWEAASDVLKKYVDRAVDLDEKGQAKKHAAAVKDLRVRAGELWIQFEGADAAQRKLVGQQNAALIQKLHAEYKKFPSLELPRWLEKAAAEFRGVEVEQKKSATTSAEAQKAFDDLKKSIGFTGYDVGALNQRLSDLQKIFQANRGQIGTNEAATKKLRDELAELDKKYADIGQKSPPELKKIIKETELLDIASAKLTDSMSEIPDIQLSAWAEEVSKSLSESTVVFGDMSAAENDLRIKSEKLVSSSGSLADSLDALSRTSLQLGGVLKDLGIFSDGAADSFGKAFSGVGALGGSLKLIQGAGDGFTGTLEKISGAIGAVGAGFQIASGIVSLFSGLFGKIDYQGYIDSIDTAGVFTDAFSGKVEELAKKLRDDSVSSWDATSRAMNAYLADQIAATTATEANFGKMADAVRRSLGAFDEIARGQTGQSIEEALGNFDQALGALYQKQKETNIVTREWVQLLQDAEGRQIQSAALQGVIADGLRTAADGVRDYLNALPDTADIRKQISDLEKDIAASDSRSSADMDAKKQKLADLQAQLASASQTVSVNWVAANQNVDAVFQSMIGSGDSLLEAVRSMREQFGDLSAIAKANGLEISQSLQEALDVSEFISQNEQLVTRIDAVNQIMDGLATSAKLSGSQFQSFQTQAVGAFEAAIAAGADTKTALSLIAPTLIDLERNAAAFGYELDEGTKALVKQGKEAGVIAEDTRDANQKVIDSLGRIGDLLLGIADAFGVKIPDALRNTTASAESLQNMEKYLQASGIAAQHLQDELDGVGDAAFRADGGVHDAFIENTVIRDIWSVTDATSTLSKKILGIGDSAARADQISRPYLQSVGSGVAGISPLVEDVISLTERGLSRAFLQAERSADGAIGGIIRGIEAIPRAADAAARSIAGIGSGVATPARSGAMNFSGLAIGGSGEKQSTGIVFPVSPGPRISPMIPPVQTGTTYAPPVFSGNSGGTSQSVTQNISINVNFLQQPTPEKDAKQILGFIRRNVAGLRDEIGRIN